MIRIDTDGYEQVSQGLVVVPFIEVHLSQGVMKLWDPEDEGDGFAKAGTGNALGLNSIPELPNPVQRVG